MLTKRIEIKFKDNDTCYNLAYGSRSVLQQQQQQQQQNKDQNKDQKTRTWLKKK